MVLRQASESQQSVLAQGTKPFTLLAVPTSNILVYPWASLVAQLLKNPLAMWETWVRSLGCEDPLEEGMTTHSSILTWRIPWIEEPGRLQSIGSKESDTTEQLTLFLTFRVFTIQGP